MFLNQCRFGIRFSLLLKAFLLATSVKNIYIPLLVWQTDELPVSSALIFTQGIQFNRLKTMVPTVIVDFMKTLVSKIVGALMLHKLY